MRKPSGALTSVSLGAELAPEASGAGISQGSAFRAEATGSFRVDRANWSTRSTRTCQLGSARLAPAGRLDPSAWGRDATEAACGYLGEGMAAGFEWQGHAAPEGQVSYPGGLPPRRIVVLSEDIGSPV